MNSLLTDAIKLLIFLVPGFISLKTVAIICDVKKEEYSYFVIEALIHSLLIYGAISLLPWAKTSNPLSIRFIFTVSIAGILFGILYAKLKKSDRIPLLLAKITKDKSTLSSHDKIFHKYRTKGIFNGWCNILLKNGKEITGIIQTYNTDNNEILIEEAIFNSKNDGISQAYTVYLPPNSDILLIREIKNGK